MVLVVLLLTAVPDGEEPVQTVEASATTTVDNTTTTSTVVRSTSTTASTTTTALASPEGAARSGAVELAEGDAPADDLDRTSVASSDREALDRLVVVVEPARSGYDRALFSHWDDADRDGCDTRCDVLSAQRGADGGWFSEWDGATEYDSSQVHVDHIVALAEAWDSGAAHWSAGQRDEFADDRGNLVAVTASSNLRKSDKDAAEWFPSRAEANCLWARTTITVKAEWELSVDPAERDALSNLLASCGAAVPVPITAAPATTAPPPPPPPPPPAGGCPSGDGYTTADGSCIDDHDADGNGDVNCGEVSSSAKPVRVHGGDPHGLDRDGDGVGCEG